MVKKKPEKKEIGEKEKNKKKFSKKQEAERQEAWMRIPVAIVSGLIFEVWGFFIFVFSLAQLIFVLIEGRKEKELLKMANVYLVQLYIFVKYITFLSNDRPFPFGDLKESINEKE